MNTITKEQVEKLTREQQTDIATITARRTALRSQLLKRARRGMSVWMGLWMGIAVSLPVLCTAIPKLLPIAIIAVCGLVTIHAFWINRRIDALLELLSQDLDEKVRNDYRPD